MTRLTSDVIGCARYSTVVAPGPKIMKLRTWEGIGIWLRNARQPVATPPLAAFQYFAFLFETGGLGGEFDWCRGVEIEHVVVAWDQKLCFDVLRKLSGFATPEVSGDSSFGGSTVDR